MPDQAAILLRRNWPSASDDVRASAWDAFHSSASPDDFAESLKGLSIPDDLKADLWDLKAGHYQPSKPVSAEQFMTPEQIRNADSNRSWPATIGEALLGAMKGVGSTAIGIGKMAAQAGALGIPTTAADSAVFQTADEAMTPTNLPQRAGKLGEFALETALPAAKVATAIPTALRAAPELIPRAAKAARDVAEHGFIGAGRKTLMKALAESLDRVAAKASTAAPEATADVEAAPVKLSYGKADRMRFGAEPPPPEPVPVPVAAPEPVPVSPNAGGTLVRDKAPTLTDELTAAMAEGEPAPPPARVTLPPPADLPPGYTPRSTAPKPKVDLRGSAAARAAAQAEASTRESATMGPRNYFLRKPTAAADVAEPAARGPISVADLPESWRARTGPIPTKTPITAAEADAVAADLQARGLSANEAIMHIARDKSLTAVERNYLMNALKKAGKRKAG